MRQAECNLSLLDRQSPGLVTSGQSPCPPVSPPVSPPRARPREGRDYWLSTVQAAVTAQPVQKESMKFTKELVMVGKGTEVIPDIVNYVFISLFLHIEIYLLFIFLFISSNGHS